MGLCPSYVCVHVCACVCGAYVPDAGHMRKAATSTTLQMTNSKTEPKTKPTTRKNQTQKRKKLKPETEPTQSPLTKQRAMGLPPRAKLTLKILIKTQKKKKSVIQKLAFWMK